MFGVEAAWPDALFVEILVRNNNNQIPARFDESPPPGDGILWVIHVFETMTAVNAVKAFRFQVLINIIAVAVLLVEWFGMRDDEIFSRTDINDTAR